jgi:hypothetical protein
MAMDPALAAEGFTRLTDEIEPANSGATKLTVTHDLTRAPGLASLVGASSRAPARAADGPGCSTANSRVE